VETPLERDRLREFVDLILDSLDETVDGEGIASRGCLSRYHFDRLVSAAIGESPGAFRRRLLLERAAWELRGGRSTITRVAIGSGYRSVEGFTRAFSRAFQVTPGRYRRSPGDFRLHAPNGVHFHPPGGLHLPAPLGRKKPMDFVDRVFPHDVWFTTRLLDRATELPADALDKPLQQGAGWHSDEEAAPTLRSLLNDMVANKEMWFAALSGGTQATNGSQTLEDMKRRYVVAGKDFLGQVRRIKERGDWDAAFVDAVCDPPESFTYGGALAHVATFSAYRRTEAALAFRELGMDVGLGDPIEWERSLA
jgi:AraC family transcriptional regulator